VENLSVTSGLAQCAVDCGGGGDKQE